MGACKCYPACAGCPSETECYCDGPKTVLEEAGEITSGDRRKAYGHPRINHGRTSKLVDAYFDVRPEGPVTMDDVVWINVLQKISRDLHSPKRDNLVDIAGFVQNLAEIRDY